MAGGSPRGRHGGRHVLVLGALALLAWTARDVLRVPAGSTPPAVTPAWVVAAVLLAPGAVLVYGEMHRQVLRAAGCSVRVLVVQAVTRAGNAMSATLPAGGSTTAVVPVRAVDASRAGATPRRGSGLGHP